MGSRPGQGDSITLERINDRLGGIERRLTALETQPHFNCPSPVLEQRVIALEQRGQRTDEKLGRIDDKLDANKSERFEQVEDVRVDVSKKVEAVRIEMSAQIGAVLTAVNEKKQAGWTRAQAIFLAIISILGGAATGLAIVLIGHAILK